MQYGNIWSNAWLEIEHICSVECKTGPMRVLQRLSYNSIFTQHNDIIVGPLKSQDICAHMVLQ